MVPTVKIGTTTKIIIMEKTEPALQEIVKKDVKSLVSHMN